MSWLHPARIGQRGKTNLVSSSGVGGKAGGWGVIFITLARAGVWVGHTLLKDGKW